jgi:glucosamine-6-phosphate deaminase
MKSARGYKPNSNPENSAHPNYLMEVIIQPTADTATEIAARIMALLLQENPQAVLGLATGSTPVHLYQKLIACQLDWSQATTFNLDEYVGVPPEHPQSYHAFMREHLFSHINIPSSRTHVPDGMATDWPAFCDDYEEKIRAAGGIDLQLLGIGTEGHIGFNEPSSSLASRTRLKTLTQQTRRDNARFFGSQEDVPFHVVTMGIGTIMEARQVLLLAFGETKAEAIAGAVEGPIGASNPASVLQWHPKATVILDEAAASHLTRAEYYRWVYEQKPAWQRI